MALAQHRAGFLRRDLLGLLGDLDLAHHGFGRTAQHQRAERAGNAVDHGGAVFFDTGKQRRGADGHRVAHLFEQAQTLVHRVERGQ